MPNQRKFQWTILFTLCCLLALCLAGFPLAVTTGDTPSASAAASAAAASASAASAAPDLVTRA